MPIKSIKSKILLILLSLSALVVVSSALLMKYGVNQGFSKYKKGLEKELNDKVEASLEAYYESENSWQALVIEPRNWHELIFNSATETIPDLDRHRKPLKQPYEDQKTKGHSKKKHSEKPGLSGKSTNKKNREKLNVIPEYSLFNAQQESLIGQVDWNNQRAKRRPLEHAGKIVGYLVYLKDHTTGSRQDKLFNQSIVKLLWVIAGIMSLVTLLATLPLAKYFTRPIQDLNQATQKAAAGDYSIRTAINRKDELGQLGKNFNLLAQTLESNSAVQKKMMADISHELRTPVAVLLAQIEAIQDGLHKADEATLGLLYEQTNTLRHLINDLHQLSVTDLGSMQYEMHPVEINKILSTVIEGQQLLAEKKQLKIELNLSAKAPVVLGDDNRLTQLFTNLISNSIHYTDETGQILIHSRVSNESDQVVIEINDSEPGLMPEEIDQMFDRLYRKEKSRSKKLGGSGLGLTIAKNITQAHNGKIMAKTSDLGGVCMIVRLPKHA